MSFTSKPEEILSALPGADEALSLLGNPVKTGFAVATAGVAVGAAMAGTMWGLMTAVMGGAVRLPGLGETPDFGKFGFGFDLKDGAFAAAFGANVVPFKAAPPPAAEPKKPTLKVIEAEPVAKTAPKAEAPKVETPKPVAAKPVVEAPKAEAKPAPAPVAAKPVVEAPKAETKPAPFVATKSAPVVEAAKPAPVATASALSKPVGLAAPRGGKADDLKMISGIGPKIEMVLNDLGIHHFDQIASWTAAEVAWVDDYLKFKGRIERDDWIEQAAALAAGGRAEYVKRFGKEPR